MQADPEGEREIDIRYVFQKAAEMLKKLSWYE